MGRKKLERKKIKDTCVKRFQITNKLWGSLSYFPPCKISDVYRQTVIQFPKVRAGMTKRGETGTNNLRWYTFHSPYTTCTFDF